MLLCYSIFYGNCNACPICRQFRYMVMRLRPFLPDDRYIGIVCICDYCGKRKIGLSSRCLARPHNIKPGDLSRMHLFFCQDGRGHFRVSLISSVFCVSFDRSLIVVSECLHDCVAEYFKLRTHLSWTDLGGDINSHSHSHHS